MSAPLDKAKLDAATDQAVMLLRDMPLTGTEAEASRAVAEFIAAQFPGSPDAGRVLVAVAQQFALAGLLSCQHLATLVKVMAEAGVRLIPREDVPGGAS